MADLLTDYLREAPETAPFYSGFSSDLWDRRDSGGAWDPTFRQALLDYQQHLGLERSIPPDSQVIITGQQPALLTGPLYTLYKAMTAIRLARAWSEKHGKPAVPVFWLGADDHDFEEARETHILGRDHASHTLRYAPEADVDGRSLFRIPAEKSLHALIDEAAAVAPGSDLSAEVARFLHESLDQASDFSDWCARILARLFRDTELLIFTTQLPAARHLAAPVIAEEIARPLASTARLLETTRALEAAGYAAQVVKAPDECNFFLESGGKRRKVTFDGAHFQLPETGETYTGEPLTRLLQQEPDRFTPNVVLRPIVQQRLFPALAYVAGPGEVAYWGQFGGVFDHFGRPAPILYPRARAALSTLKLSKLLKRYGLTPEDLGLPKDDLIERALRTTVKHPASDALEKARGPFEEATAALAAQVTAAAGRDQSVADGARSFEDQARQALLRLDRLLLRKDEAQVETVARQIDRLTTALRPDKKPQERHYSPFSFVFEQGWRFVPEVLESLDDAPYAERVIER